MTRQCRVELNRGGRGFNSGRWVREGSSEGIHTLFTEIGHKMYCLIKINDDEIEDMNTFNKMRISGNQ